MPELNFEVENLESIEETFRPLYKEVEQEVEKDGVKTKIKAYQLNAVGAKSEKDIEGYRTALNKERAFREAAEKNLKAFGTLTPETAREMESKLKNFEVAGSSKTEEDFRKRLEDTRSAHQAQLLEYQNNWNSSIAEKDKIISEKEGEITGLMLFSQLSEAYAEKGVEGGLDVALDFAKRDLELNKDTKKFVTKDGLLTVKQWLNDVLWKDRPFLLKANVSAGANRPSSLGGVNWEEVFNPNSKGYRIKENMQKRVQLFKDNPDRAYALAEKYKK